MTGFPYPDGAAARAIGWARRLLAQVGPIRLSLACLLLAAAGTCARYGYGAEGVDGALHDLIGALAAPQVEQDRRIVLVTFTDDTLRRIGRRSPVDRAVIARALRRLDGLGATAIALDFIFDQPQPEDPALVAALRSMRTPTYVGYAVAGDRPDGLFDWQQAFLDGLLARAATPNVRRASVELLNDPDGTPRRWPPPRAGQPPVIARAVAGPHPRFADYEGAIRFRLPRSGRPVFDTLGIDLFSDPVAGSTAYANLLRERVAGRYVLVGGDLTGEDRFVTSASKTLGDADASGVEVHAAMLAQLLDGAAYAPLPGWTPWLGALLALLAGVAAALLDIRLGWLIALAVGQAVAVVAGGAVLQGAGVDTTGLPMGGWMVGWVLAFTGIRICKRAIGAEQRRFAQFALGRYLPRDVATAILREPDRLRLSGEKREIYALFSDLEDFTRLTEGQPAEVVAQFLNGYLHRLSEIVFDHGGTLDKYVGDAVVAFWGAPFARSDDADRAVAAAIAIHAAGERYRTGADAALDVGRTRVGVHFGEALVGNFGGDVRIQYTALGDVMNCASRLESANKHLGTTVLVSEQVASRSTLELFRPMGRVLLSGRATPMPVYEPVPDFPAADLRAMAGHHRRFEQGDRTAIDGLAALVARHPHDRALAAFVDRLERLGPGASYVLGGK